MGRRALAATREPTCRDEHRLPRSAGKPLRSSLAPAFCSALTRRAAPPRAPARGSADACQLPLVHPSHFARADRAAHRADERRRRHMKPPLERVAPRSTRASWSVERGQPPRGPGGGRDGRAHGAAADGGRGRSAAFRCRGILRMPPSGWCFKGAGRETRTEPRRRGAHMSDAPTPLSELGRRQFGILPRCYFTVSCSGPAGLSRKSSTAMSGSWETCEKKAATLRPVAPRRSP